MCVDVVILCDWKRLISVIMDFEAPDTPPPSKKTKKEKSDEEDGHNTAENDDNDESTEIKAQKMLERSEEDWDAMTQIVESSLNSL